MVKQYGDLYLDTRRALLAKEDPQTASFMARNLLCHVSGLPQEVILGQRDNYASESVVRGVEAGLKRLLEGEPLAYVLGEWEFYGLNLTVTPDVLIPRDDRRIIPLVRHNFYCIRHICSKCGAMLPGRKSLCPISSR